MTDALRVLIADDHPPTRAGVRAALEDAGWEVSAEVSDAPSAVKAALDDPPDVCLLDIHMPGDGVAASAEITEALPDTAVVMLTVSRNDGDLFSALRAGASGYLLKDIDPGRLPHALQGVLNGEAAIPRNLVTRLMEEFRGRERRRVILPNRRGPELTSREWEVLDGLSRGLSTNEVAAELHIAAVTVRTYISSILKKLKVPNREAALRLLGDGIDQKRIER
jgi:DNA-binding NarL/FixJ family response regulator